MGVDSPLIQRYPPTKRPSTESTTHQASIISNTMLYFASWLDSAACHCRSARDPRAGPLSVGSYTIILVKRPPPTTAVITGPNGCGSQKLIRGPETLKCQQPGTVEQSARPSQLALNASLRKICCVECASARIIPGKGVELWNTDNKSILHTVKSPAASLLHTISPHNHMSGRALLFTAAGMRTLQSWRANRVFVVRDECKCNLGHAGAA
ncbi:hypothetical protein PR048_014533 [Dryococelus australis]|uniref:Uncharacterized protein n=1 Tax=Dryococelus australis TaxID=614101 RepID=A0ABQ9HEG5_9NEOP|nr:hypothetical protein PR048_014533 [Dryococelus australis]